MEHQLRRRPALDFVIPCHNERIFALNATVEACCEQPGDLGTVWVIDDGSGTPVSRRWLRADDRIRVLRLDPNRGISAARMAAISRSTADYVACVNVDVLPARDWAYVCSNYLSAHQRVGAVFTVLKPQDAAKSITRWRMRFHEQKYDWPTGPTKFAPGHAVLFRRCALESVGGYDLSKRLIHEDSDICERMSAVGWETHFLAQSECVSIQDDSLRYLARKQLGHDGFDPSVRNGTIGLARKSVHSFVNHIGRNVFRGRWAFVPIDIGVFMLELGYIARESLMQEREKAT